MDEEKKKLALTWRGRTVLAYLSGDLSNLFVGLCENPRDFTCGPPDDDVQPDHVVKE